jgi:hypothetical protein
MNRGQVAGGIICLALAALLAVLNLRLPADEIMFNVGGQNMPWLPVAGLGVVGVLLLATAGRGRRRAQGETAPAERVLDPDKAEEA